MLTVIIPTLNVDQALESTLTALVPAVVSGVVRQLIVSDGGSQDHTVALAHEAGADIVTGPPGRGNQLALGASAARGDWLLFLHADTLLEPGWDVEVKQFIAEAHAAGDTERVAYFRFRLNDRQVAARWLERIVSARCRFLALPYGDQGLLISKAFYEKVGGFKNIPLMEDVELVRRVGRGRLVGLSHAAVTSAARYRREGYVKRVMRNASCLAMWFAGVAPERIVRFYR
ncbi:MAG: TIGR04283 family arsenosugar biosynthesis glycosyltransferase [Pseudomonadota bacterium]